MKGCVISAPMSGSGKTTVTLGLLSALRKRGIAVQPFKVGPDFIDTGLHEIAAGVPSHNLDGWMLSRETNERVFAQACQGKELAIVEGVMGLYDGFDGKSEGGSTAEMAKWLGLPVVLVIDAYSMARSVGALVQGFKAFDPEVKIAGVIFNRVGGEGHYRMLADAVAAKLDDTPFLGWLPVDGSVEIPERHLGLFTAPEVTAEKISAIGEFVEKHVGAFWEEWGRGLKPATTKTATPADVVAGFSPRPHSQTVALAQDSAFSFYYHANRMALEEAGARIVEFSPLKDEALPEADFLYIGGGYPELYQKQLEANTSMIASVRRFIESGKRFYAECGGLMYLAQIGIVPAKIEMTDRLVDFGYCEISTTRQSIFGPAGTVARGHQFHYSRCVSGSGNAYEVRQGQRTYTEGFILPNGIASYIHLHFLSNPALARNMLNS